VDGNRVGRGLDGEVLPQVALHLGHVGIIQAAEQMIQAQHALRRILTGGDSVAHDEDFVDAHAVKLVDQRFGQLHAGRDDGHAVGLGNGLGQFHARFCKGKGNLLHVASCR